MLKTNFKKIGFYDFLFINTFFYLVYLLLANIRTFIIFFNLFLI